MQTSLSGAEPKVVGTIARRASPAPRPRAKRETCSSIAAVWDEQTFRGLSRYMPPDRLRAMLDLFDQRLGEIQLCLKEGRSDRSLWAVQVHCLVSIAGTFGFLRLGEISRLAQELIALGKASPATYEGSLFGALGEARRALHDPGICGPIVTLRAS